jgi:hypothetical protein
MALEIVWRNPVLQLRNITDIELVELDRDASIYIAHGTDTMVVLHVDQAPAHRRLADHEAHRGRMKSGTQDFADCY